MRNQLRADLARTRHEIDHARGNARLLHQLHCFHGDQWCLLRRLCHYAIARHQRRRNLAGENRQREIPRRYAHKHPAAMQGQGVFLPCWALHQLACSREILAAPVGVITRKIHGLAHFGQCIGDIFSGLAYAETHQFFNIFFEQVCEFLKIFRAHQRVRLRPFFKRFTGHAHGFIGQPFVPRPDQAEIIGFDRRVFNIRGRGIFINLAADQWCGLIGVVEFPERLENILHLPVIGQIDAQRIQPPARRFGFIQVARHRDFRVADVDALADRRNRVGHKLRRRNIMIQNLVHEGCIRAILQQAAHKIRQQLYMRADRRVNADRHVAVLAQDGIKCITHTVELLKFKRRPGFLGHLDNRRRRMRVMGAEHRENIILEFKQLRRTAQIGKIGIGLARKHRIIG